MRPHDSTELIRFIESHRRIARVNALGQQRARLHKARAERQRSFDKLNKLFESVVLFVDDLILSLDHFDYEKKEKQKTS